MFDEASQVLHRNRKVPVSLGNAERNRANLSELQHAAVAASGSHTSGQPQHQSTGSPSPAVPQSAQHQQSVFRVRQTERVINAGTDDAEKRMRQDMLARLHQPHVAPDPARAALDRPDVFDAEFERIQAEAATRQTKKEPSKICTDEFDF